MNKTPNTKIDSFPGNPDAINVPPDFDIKNAMNTKDFLEFLAKYPDAQNLDMADENALKQRFDVFVTKDKAAKEMESFVVNELDSQNLGIKFNDAELGSHVKEEVLRMAYEDPEKMVDLFNTLSEFNELNKLISEEKAKLDKLGDWDTHDEILENLKKKEQVLESASETEKHFGTSSLTRVFAIFSGTHGQRYIDRKIAKDTYGIKLDSESIQAELEKTKNEMADLKDKMSKIEDAEAVFDYATERNKEIGKILRASLSMDDKIKDLAKEKVENKLGELLKTKPDEARKFFEAIQGVSNANSLGIDYFDGKEGDIEKKIDERIEQQVLKDMKDVIEKASFGGKAYDKLSTSLSGFINRQEVGSKKGDEAREFIMKTLEYIAFQFSTKDVARSLLVRSLIATLSK